MDPIRITVDEVKKIMDRGEAILFIDTRNPVAWSESKVRIHGAIRMHYSEMEQHLQELPHDRMIVPYCT